MNKLIIIDSDVAATQAIQSALSIYGVDIRATADGNDGLALAHSDRPDCIILCVELARGSGYSVCNKLRKDPQIADLPLILASVDATEETFEQHKKLKTRADHYLKKPYDVDELLRVLGHYLNLDDGAPAQPRPKPHEMEPTQALDMIAAPEAFMDEATTAYQQVSAGRADKASANDGHFGDGQFGDDLLAEALGMDKSSEATRVVRRDTLAKPMQSESKPAAAPERMLNEETQTFALETPVVRVADAQNFHPTVRPSVGQNSGRQAGPRDTVVNMHESRGALEVLPDAAAESRAQSKYEAVAQATQQAADRAASQAVSHAPPPRGAPGAHAAQPGSQTQGVEVLRQEIRGLRQKVQELEQALESAEVAHSERLVAESKRGNESVDLKKKIVSLEREALKVQESTHKQKTDWDATVAELAAARTAIAEGQRGHSELVRQHEALTREHTALQASHADVTSQMQALQTAHESLQAGHAGTLAAWQRARQAVDNTLELIDGTGILAPT